jgi:outer membrane protein assembly factor BamD (BamD/ComL family)
MRTNLQLRLHLLSLLALAMCVLVSSGCRGLRTNGKNPLSKLLGGSSTERQNELADASLDPLGKRDGNRLLLDDLSPSQLATTLKVRTGMGVDESTANAAYAKATDLYERAAAQKQVDPDGDSWQAIFVEAANEFRIAAANWPDSTLEEKAIFFEGEAYFFADRYVQANRAFEKLIAQYAGSSYLDRAEKLRFVISKYWLELSENGAMVSVSDPKRPKFNLAGEARRVLHNIRLDDPTGKLADDATFELANAFLKSGQFYEAADTYEDLRRNYPGSSYVFPAHMLELESRLKAYQGPSYDAMPLEKAEKLLKQIVRQFPKEASENRDVLEQQAALITNQLAQRVYDLGQFHEKRGENRAAQLCYQRVAQEYPDSVYGSEVNQSIAKVAALPAVPDQHAKWLVNMFPDPEADKPVITAGDNESVFR